MGFLNEIELRLIPVTVSMETRGFFIDHFKLNKIKEKLSNIKGTIEGNFMREGVNLNSPKQVKEYLLKKGFGNDLIVYVTTGQAQSTNKTVLKHLAKKTPIAQEILDYRQAAKLLSTYVKPMGMAVTWKGNFNQVGTITGRYSSSKPNLQNIPHRTELGKEIRSCLGAMSGTSLIISDLSQIEPRLFAHFSKDNKLINIFTSNKDFHTAVTKQVYQMPPEMEPSKEQRFVGKTVGLATLYGARTKRLQETLFNYGVDISYIKVNEIRESIIKVYPEAWDWANKFNSTAPRTGYVETLLKRRIPTCPGMNCVNTLIQGSCADILKVCMLNLYTLKYNLIVTIHDEIILEVPDFVGGVNVEDNSHPELKVKDVMENSVRLESVPIISDTVRVKNWGER